MTLYMIGAMFILGGAMWYEDHRRPQDTKLSWWDALWLCLVWPFAMGALLASYVMDKEDQ